MQNTAKKVKAKDWRPKKKMSWGKKIKPILTDEEKSTEVEQTDEAIGQRNSLWKGNTSSINAFSYTHAEVRKIPSLLFKRGLDYLH